MRYLAIDPGSAHVGWAGLQSSEGRYYLSLGVLDVGSRSFQQLISSLIAVRPSRLIIESYKQRPVGHQRFASGETLQIIGALRYAVASEIFFKVPPGNPAREIEALGLEPLLKVWSRGWDDPRNKDWQHARAAWRILGRHLLSTNSLTLQILRSKKALKTIELCSMRGLSVEGGTSNDLFAQTLSLRI